MRSPFKNGLLKNGLLETTWLDKLSRDFAPIGGEIKKEGLLVGEKVAAAIERAMM